MINTIKEKGLLRCIIFVFVSILYKTFRIVYEPILNLFKIKDNYIIFQSFPDYSDNAKALFEYMNKKEDNLKYIWFIDRETDLNRLKNLKIKNTVFIKYNSFYHRGINLKALYYLKISKLICFTHSSPARWAKIKKEQLVINLWHGCGYKAVETTNWISKSYFDYVLVPGNVFVETKSEFFGCEKSQILPIGYPRYNLLLNENIESKEYTNKLKKENLKLIIWMPTYRKTKRGNYPEEKIDYGYELPILTSDEDIIRLNEVCKENNIMLCIKRHPFQLKYNCEKLDLSNIIFIDNQNLVNEKVDLYSVLKYTDALISDYSSIAIDYILLDKPMAFCLDDFEKYNKSRGFVFNDPKKYMPGHHLYSFDDMVNFIMDITNNIDKFSNNRSAICDDVHNKTDDYCEKIIKEIEKLKKER